MTWPSYVGNFFLVILGMREMEKPFELEFEGKVLQVSEHELAGKRVFHVSYGPGAKPLVIAVAIGANGKKFWTSIPQGRQKEATDIGKLIADHIRAKRK
ncbi:hypothetical protein FFJ24_021340 [Pedobacter sp. KBS0701]|uniref:hypothetical protein n=1 Tax=Pedobacter sp. KBS0701 TaxID=2578106 RepID=UPI0011A331D2|nr:hypothetical protein [Pedobacter sp. KBS0701]QDW27232.1 hypothetical protein FFJ24_021340 [Pedobacter sp. KBS0701]